MEQIKKAENIEEKTEEAIRRLLQEKSEIMVAIDGRCAGGKTTLAEGLREKLACNVIHTDDFFLRPFQRTAERLSLPGGNMDYERLEEEVLRPLKANREACYQPYDCKTGGFKAPVFVTPKAVTLIEGSYSCHPALYKYYDLHIFLTVGGEEQRKRILARNKENAEMFFTKWIPLEEKYFKACNILASCDILCYT